MSRNKARNKPRKNKTYVGEQAKEALCSLDEDSPVIQAFRSFSFELDDKHDRYERIVKLNRDITIESKRIIFLLHSTQVDFEAKKIAILEEADSRLKSLCQNNFKAIALELRSHDPYLYHRAFTSGLQEFIEALCFYQFTKNECFDNWKIINGNFQYTDDTEASYSLLFSQCDFVLGIADFTGELMRKCINNLGIGNISECFKICNFVKSINTGFLGLIHAGNKEISRKVYTLRQSLNKMELVCYNIQIRGSEIPKHMLLNVLDSHDIENNEDEGFCM
ncbi:translin-associated protein X [Sitophilus oryzae]|uniref:Translin-associated protein X n=1 Tax=Sitophilus oryzae TaxID=7048 RepID=A0A6J2YJJ2_SITOR|nr:translin-associated protein X [Sitophilus oryzae]